MNMMFSHEYRAVSNSHMKDTAVGRVTQNDDIASQECMFYKRIYGGN